MKQQSIIYEHKYWVTKDPFIYQYMPRSNLWSNILHPASSPSLVARRPAIFSPSFSSWAPLVFFLPTSPPYLGWLLALLVVVECLPLTLGSKDVKISQTDGQAEGERDKNPYLWCKTLFQMPEKISEEVSVGVLAELVENKPVTKIAMS